MKDPMRPMMVNGATTELAKFRGSIVFSMSDGSMAKTVVFERKNSTIYMSGCSQSDKPCKLQMTTGAVKMLDWCTILLTSQNDYQGNSPLNTVVRFTLSDYANAKGTPTTESSLDKIRKDVKTSLDALMAVMITWTENKKSGSKKFGKMRIIGAYEIKNSAVSVEFTNKMANALDVNYMTRYPLALLQVDERNPSAYVLGRKMALHNAMKNNKRKGTANILSVKSLLECCEDILTYDEVRTGDRNYKRHIITPFISAMNKQNVFSWNFCNEKQIPLFESQNVYKYKDFIELYVHFE